MRRGPLVGLLVVVLIGVADAGPTRKVAIDSDPAGAQVYLNSLDDGTACPATPCTIDAPIGVTAVILRKEGYDPGIEQIDVPRTGKVKTFKFSLTTSTGTLVFEDPAYKGATIQIDGTDSGTAPKRVDVPAMSHSVKLVLKNKELEVTPDFPTVEAGAEVAIKLATGTPVVERSPGRDDRPMLVKTAPPPRRRFITVGVALDVNFRHFVYDNPSGGLNADEDETGQDLLGPTVELWPMELARSSHLRGLSIFGKYGYGINHIEVLDKGTMMSAGTSTKWSNLELDLRQRWTVGEASGFELSAGFVRDEMSYTATTPTDLAKVPVVDYKSVRLGLGGVTSLGSVQTYARVEGRIVLDGGPLAKRFDKADVIGGRAVVGLSTKLGPIFASLEGSLVYYRWTFTTNNPAAGQPTADGASDRVAVISIQVGIQH